MGNYITETLLEERMTESRLASLCKVTGTAKTTLITNVIARAESLIDAYAAERYETPLPSNELTEEWALNIAEYELYKRGSSNDVPQKIKDSYEDALQLLSELAIGKLSIPSATKPVPVNEEGSSIIVSSAPALMNEENIREF
jgi:phage gp36-like protein